LSIEPVLLFLIIFFWTPPHFWALALFRSDDYARAGVPMLPVVATPLAVARRIVAYAWLTVATSLVLWPLATSWVYGAVALAAGAWFLAGAHGLLARVRRGVEPRALRLFHLSNSYLAVLFVAVAVDALVR